MLKTNYFLLQVIILALAMPSLCMNDAIQLKALFSIKYKITQENFDHAMREVHDRSAGEYLSEKLDSALRKFVGKELSMSDWHKEVNKAYNEILRVLDPPSLTSLIREAHPIDEIIAATTWALGN